MEALHVLEGGALATQLSGPRRAPVLPLLESTVWCTVEVVAQLRRGGETVTTFVVKLVHPPDQCPMANAKVRERAQSMGQEIGTLSEKMGIKMVLAPHVLGSEHESITVVEADRIENVNEFVQQSGLIQWNTVHISMAEPLDQAMGRMDSVPPPLY